MSRLSGGVWLRWVALGVVVGVVTAVDIVGGFSYVPYWPVALAVGGVVLSVVLMARARLWMGMGAVLIVWLLILPGVRWNSVKSFYIDCGRIEQGMEIEAVRSLMASYRLQRDAAEEIGRGEEGLERPHMTFHPSISRSADWCVVYTDGDRVAEVEAIPD